MKQELLQKIEDRLGEAYTWWWEDDTLYIENDGKQSEVYLEDLEYDFEKSIKTIINEVV